MSNLSLAFFLFLCSDSPVAVGVGQSWYYCGGGTPRCLIQIPFALVIPQIAFFITHVKMFLYGAALSFSVKITALTKLKKLSDRHRLYRFTSGGKQKVPSGIIDVEKSFIFVV